VNTGVSISVAPLGLAFAGGDADCTESMPLAVPCMRVMLLALTAMYLVTFVMSLLIRIGDSTRR
jgi:hypothetical protein